MMDLNTGISTVLSEGLVDVLSRIDTDFAASGCDSMEVNNPYGSDVVFNANYFISIHANASENTAANGTEVKVWDPMYKEGSDRFEVPGRKGKVRLDGTDAYADFSEIEKDCFERPFFLFEKPE